MTGPYVYHSSTWKAEAWGSRQARLHKQVWVQHRVQGRSASENKAKTTKRRALEAQWPVCPLWRWPLPRLRVWRRDGHGQCWSSRPGWCGGPRRGHCTWVGLEQEGWQVAPSADPTSPAHVACWGLTGNGGKRNVTWTRGQSSNECGCWSFTRRRRETQCHAVHLRICLEQVQDRKKFPSKPWN